MMEVKNAHLSAAHSDAAFERKPDQKNQPMTRPIQAPTRCGAKTRRGTPCQSLPVCGKRRCRMHGGAPGSGAPFGRRNGNYRHGHFSSEAKQERRRLRLLVQDARKMVKSLV
jgi:hypothetical protein